MQTLSRGLLTLALALLAPLARADEAAQAIMGFDLVWEKRPHRLNVIGVGVRPGESGPEPWSDVAGGTWANGAMASDAVAATVHTVGLRGGDRQVARGSEPFALVGSWARRPSDQLKVLATHRIEVALDEPAEAAGVWLSGLRVAAGPDHPDGYTTQGLTVSAGPVEVQGDRARFDLTVCVLAAAAPSRIQDLASYTAQVTVDWTLLTAQPDAISRQEVAVESWRRRRFFAEPDPPLRAAMAWRPPEGAAEVLVGLSGFSFSLDGRGALDGRFWRQLTVGLGEERVEGGEWSASAALRLSNAGAITRPTRTTASASWTALALQEDERASRAVTAF